MRKFVAFAFFAAAALFAITVFPASSYTANAVAGGIDMGGGAIEVASPSATIFAFNPQPDPPGLVDGDDGYDRS